MEEKRQDLGTISRQLSTTKSKNQDDIGLNVEAAFSFETSKSDCVNYRWQNAYACKLENPIRKHLKTDKF
jgi:hypothetical protein